MRKLSEIAKDISADFVGAKSSFARPYINAMKELSTLDDMYGCDDATGIVIRFLCNAQTWRGSIARTIKAELKDMLREHGIKI